MTQVANSYPLLESPGCLFLELDFALNCRETMVGVYDAGPAN